MTQRYYTGRKFNSIAVNILVAHKMAEKLVAHPREWAMSNEASTCFDNLPQLTAAAAHDKFEDLRARGH